MPDKNKIYFGVNVVYPRGFLRGQGDNIELPDDRVYFVVWPYLYEGMDSPDVLTYIRDGIGGFDNYELKEARDHADPQKRSDKVAESNKAVVREGKILPLKDLHCPVPLPKDISIELKIQNNGETDPIAIPETDGRQQGETPLAR